MEVTKARAGVPARAAWAAAAFGLAAWTAAGAVAASGCVTAEQLEVVKRDVDTLTKRRK